MKNLHLLCWFSAMVMLTASCDIINPEESIPAYIHIPAFDITTNNLQGTSSHRITDAWVGVDNQLVGAYFLPATFPVLASGEHTISVFPGVIENGISSTREIYPFIANYSVVVDLEETKIDTINPVSTYTAETEFVFIEDFETGNIFGDDLDGNPSTTMSRTTSMAFEGQGAGRINLLDDFALGSAGTTIQYVLPTDGRDIFLEMHYKNEIEFSVGIIGISVASGSQSLIKLTLLPREDWNKVYISIDEEVLLLNADFYQIFLQAEKPNSLEEANIYVDNIKLLHF